MGRSADHIPRIDKAFEEDPYPFTHGEKLIVLYIAAQIIDWTQEHGFDVDWKTVRKLADNCYLVLKNSDKVRIEPIES